jgi:hypothetical protein
VTRGPSLSVARRKRLSRGERIVGILAGLVLGFAAVVGFVLLGGDQTIDTPLLDQPAQSAAERVPDSTPPVRTIRIVGGAPPPAGPPTLDYRRGDRVRLRIVFDAPVDVELIGYGVRTAAPAGRSAAIRFTASRTEDFPLVVASSHLSVGTLEVSG